MHSRYKPAILGAIAIHVLCTGPVAAQEPRQAPVPKDTIDGWMIELSNWGRWGADDQLGTLNLITPEKRAAAARLVETGNVISLARPLPGDTAGPDNDVIGYQLRKGAGGAVDSYAIDYHGYAFTHIDALAHMFVDGKLYNGAAADDFTSTGAGSMGIDAMAQGIVTRAVLVDVPRLEGVPYLEPGAVITVADLEEWETQTGIRIGSGDALLLSTGRWRRVAEVGPWQAGSGLAGLPPSAAHWLRERDVAVLGCDCVSDPTPQAGAHSIGNADTGQPGPDSRSRRSGNASALGVPPRRRAPFSGWWHRIAGYSTGGVLNARGPLLLPLLSSPCDR
jgi:kynurenine formamidase